MATESKYKAIHEAAHAVIAIYYNYNIIDFKFDENKDVISTTVELVAFENLISKNFTQERITDTFLNQFKKELQIYLAGRIAEKKAGNEIELKVSREYFHDCIYESKTTDKKKTDEFKIGNSIIALNSKFKNDNIHENNTPIRLCIEAFKECETILDKNSVWDAIITVAERIIEEPNIYHEKLSCLIKNSLSTKKIICLKTDL